MNRLNCNYILCYVGIKARGLQSVRKLPKNILKHLGIAHKILRYKVNKQKQKIIKKNHKM